MIKHGGSILVSPGGSIPVSAKALSAFRHHIKRLWLRTLRRRSQKDRFPCSEADQ
jgi:hypothetical protein